MASRNLTEPSTPPIKRETAQTTLSAIGDVSVAVADAAKAGDGRRKANWLVVFLFLLAAGGGTAALLYLLHETSQKILIAVPSVMAVCATAVFWLKERQAARAREEKAKLQAWREALEAVGFEAANAANAVRANLIGYRGATSPRAAAAHLQEIADALKRIDAIMARARDPLAWQAMRKKQPQRAK